MKDSNKSNITGVLIETDETPEFEEADTDPGETDPGEEEGGNENEP